MPLGFLPWGERQVPVRYDTPYIMDDSKYLQCAKLAEDAVKSLEKYIKQKYPYLIGHALPVVGVDIFFSKKKTPYLVEASNTTVGATSWCRLITEGLLKTNPGKYSLNLSAVDVNIRIIDAMLDAYKNTGGRGKPTVAILIRYEFPYVSMDDINEFLRVANDRNLEAYAVSLAWLKTKKLEIKEGQFFLHTPEGEVGLDVIYRRTTTKWLEKILGDKLKAIKTPWIDPLEADIINDKAEAELAFRSFGQNILRPKTLLPEELTPTMLSNFLNKYPTIVFKALDDYGGSGVWKVDNYKQAFMDLEKNKKQLIAQVFIETDKLFNSCYDIRWHVANGIPVHCFCRVATQGSFKSNICSGGFAVPVIKKSWIVK